MKIKIKRVYEELAKEDGMRILVDRLWPRGLTKEKAHLDLWLKDIAPSPALRIWFAHEPKKLKAFSVKYKLELKNKTDLINQIKRLGKEAGVITFLYAAKDEKCNHALVLKSVFH